LNRTCSILVASLFFAFLLNAQVTSQELLKSPGDDWLTYHGDYAGKRFSPLREINTDTVSGLVPKWIRHFDTSSDLEATPLVYQGVMYTTAGNELYALDAITGREIWHYRSTNSQGRGVNRGAAIWGDRLFFTTSDCHLLSFRRSNGAVLWDREFASKADGYSCSGAPFAVKGRILVGVASSGITCFVAALSAEDGKEDWRIWAVPKPGEPGADTWGQFPLKQGGGPMWTVGTYDPDLNLIYLPTGNPWPDFHGGDRPGDNLYTDCMLAVDADTGKMKWHFQFVPHDTHDWDANETPILVDMDFRGRPRKLLIQANRDGFYYVLDRQTGEFLLGTPFVKELNWATGLDAKGRPILRPDNEPSAAGTLTCPSVHGATNWWSPSLNSDLGLLYVVTLEQCELYYSSSQKPVANSGFRGTGHNIINARPGQFYLRAIDSATGKLRWEFPMPGPTTMWAGTVATAGNLVFSADDDGDLVGFNARTGEPLWHFSTGTNLHASPMTFGVNGHQYVTIASGTNLITFGLSKVP
jgi:alcohol dehydrogenase (cytochrome c)